MTRALAILALLTIATAQPVYAQAQLPTVGKPDKARDQRAIEQVITFRKNLATAIGARNETLLRTMYADAFVQTHGTGEQDGREARIAAVLAGDPVIETLPAEDLDIHIHGGCMAVATAISRRIAKDGASQVLAWTAIYVRKKGGWQLAASHVTRLAVPTP